MISMLTHGCQTKAKQINKKTPKQSEIDWIKIYEEEIRIAIVNQDKDAWNFFTVELLREKLRLKRQQLADLENK